MNHKQPARLILSPRLALIIGTLFLMMLACSLPNRVSGVLPTDTFGPTETPVPLPTPALTPEISSGGQAVRPSGGSANCYPGSWSSKNISDLITPILVENKIQNVQYTGSTGSLVLSFTTNGKMTFQANQFHNLFSAKLGFLPITVDVLIDGSGTGDYSVDNAGSLLISNPDFSGINFSAKAVSIEVVPATPIKSLIPALQDNLSGQTANLGSTCNGNNLSFDPGISGVSALLFDRLKQ